MLSESFSPGAIVRLSALMFVLVSLHGTAQDNPTTQAQPIVAEGKRLYKSEMASWYGTDLFLEKYKVRENIGGYFSYETGDAATCVFFSRGDDPKIIGTISFDESYDINTANADLSERDFTANETALYNIRKATLALINSDTLFRTYKNTSLNIIPLITGQEKKVYVLTGPSQSGVVIFGNDYLVTFDEADQVTGRKQLHKNIIPIAYGDSDSNDKQVIGTMHSHLPETGEFITATDICTLMLYSKLAKWKQHNVVSRNYLNIWNCETNQLTVIPLDSKKKRKKD